MVNLVIGETGFIGNSIKKRLEESLDFDPNSWDISTLGQNIEKLKNIDGLKVYWAAGNNGNYSTKIEIEREIKLVSFFLQKVKEIGLNIKQINLISSAGSIYAGSMDSSITEMSLENPISEYGKSRIKIENLFKDYSKLNNIQINIFRLTNVFGYKSKNKLNSGVINNLILANINRFSLNIFVSLYTKQDYIDINFASKNIVSIAENRFITQNSIPKTYILSRNHSHSIQEIVAIINRITNKKTPIRMQFDPNQNLRNANLIFNVNNNDFVKYKITPLEFEIRKLILELIYDKVA